MLTTLAVIWVLQALGGLSLLAVWLRYGGHRQRELVYEPSRRGGVPAEERRAEARARGGESGISLALIFSHGAMALMGVALAIGIAAGSRDGSWEGVSWLLFAWVLVLAALGVKMLLVGSPERARAARESPVEPAEHHFPRPVVLLHGIGATAVIVVTLLVALGVGR